MARVVRDLEQLGVPSGEISLVANRHVSEQSANVDDASATASGAGIGAAVGGGAGLGLMAIPGLGPDVAVGWLASTLIGAATGTAAGSLVGLLVDAGTSEPDAHVFSETARRGGTLVTARTSLPAEQVAAVLDRHAPVDIATRRREYEAAGWKTFDPDAPAYTPTQAELERMRRPYEG